MGLSDGALCQKRWHKVMKSDFLSQIQRWIIISFTTISTALAINQVFDLQFFIGSIWQNVIYHFALLGLLLPLIFIVKPFPIAALGSGVK